MRRLLALIVAHVHQHDISLATLSHCGGDSSVLRYAMAAMPVEAIAERMTCAVRVTRDGQECRASTIGVGRILDHRIRHASMRACSIVQANDIEGSAVLIRGRWGDYIMIVKENQLALRVDIIAA